MPHNWERDCQDFAAASRAETPNADQRLRVDLANDEVLKEPLKLSEMINRLKANPFESVRVIGPKVFLRVCAVQYHALGQYANAAEALRFHFSTPLCLKSIAAQAT